MTKRNIIITSAGVLFISFALLSAFIIHQNRTPLPAGNVDKVDVKPIVSVLYTEKDYDEAVECVKEYFPKFENCELRTLRYCGDLVTTEETNFYPKEENGAEYIILMSDFYVNPEPLFRSCQDAWNHDSMYTNWSWILCRENGTSEWTVCDCGYL